VTALTGLVTIFAQNGLQQETFNADKCPGNNGTCVGWILDHFGNYTTPLLQHIVLSVVPLVAGFVIATALAILAHRQRWLQAPLLVFVTILFTIPSIAAFLILIPLIGFGTTTAFVALTAYTLVLIYRNVISGLGGVPRSTVEAAQGMGLSDNQILWRVELPLAMPTILAGVRIAASSTVGIAGFAFFAGAGGLGRSINESFSFRGNVVAAGLLMVLLAAVLELIVLAVQRVLTPWERAAR
jgi:osmoprotectant transport system permease protein